MASILEFLGNSEAKIGLINRILRSLKDFKIQKINQFEINYFKGKEQREMVCSVKEQIQTLKLIKLVLGLEDFGFELFDSPQKKKKLLFSSKFDSKLLNIFLDFKGRATQSKRSKKATESNLDGEVLSVSEPFDQFDFNYEPSSRYKIPKKYRRLKYFELYKLVRSRNDSKLDDLFSKTSNIIFDKISEKLCKNEAIGVGELKVYKEFIDLVNHLRADLNFQHGRFLAFLADMQVCKLNVSSDPNKQNRIVNFWELVSFDMSALVKTFSKPVGRDPQIDAEAKVRVILSWFLNFKNRKILGSFIDFLVNLTGESILDFLLKDEQQDRDDADDNHCVRSRNLIRAICLYEFIAFQDLKFTRSDSEPEGFDAELIEQNLVISEVDTGRFRIRDQPEKDYVSLELVNLVAFFKCAAMHIAGDIESLSKGFFRRIGEVLNDQRNGLKLRESLRMYLSQLIREKLETKFDEQVAEKLEFVYPQKNVLFYPFYQEQFFAKFDEIRDFLRRSNFKRVKALIKTDKAEVKMIDEFRRSPEHKSYDLNFICMLSYCLKKETFDPKQKPKRTKRISTLVDLFRERGEPAKFRLLQAVRRGFGDDSMLFLNDFSGRKPLNLLLLNIVSSILSSFRLKSVFFPDADQHKGGQPATPDKPGEPKDQPAHQQGTKSKQLLNLLYVVSSPESLNDPSRLFHLLHNQANSTDGDYESKMYLVHFHILPGLSKHVNKVEYLVFRVWHLICHAYLLVLGRIPECDQLEIIDKFHRDLKAHDSSLCDQSPEEYLFTHVRNDIDFLKDFFQIECTYFHECLGAAFNSMNQQFLNVIF